MHLAFHRDRLHPHHSHRANRPRSPDSTSSKLQTTFLKHNLRHCRPRSLFTSPCRAPAMTDSRPSTSLEHPFMLDDLKRNFQRLSASLPPDGWDFELPTVHVERQVSGILNFLQSDIAATGGADTRHSADLTRKEGGDEEDGLLPTTNIQARDVSIRRIGRRPSNKRRGPLKGLCHRPCLPRRHLDTFSSSFQSVIKRLKDAARRMWSSKGTGTRPWWKRKRRDISDSQAQLLWEGV